MLALLFRDLHHHSPVWQILQCLQPGPEMSKTHALCLPWGETEKTSLSWEELQGVLWGSLWCCCFWTRGAILSLGFPLQVA